MTAFDWLLDSDPSIRWQVMRELTEAPGDVTAAERSRVALGRMGGQVRPSQDSKVAPQVRFPVFETQLFRQMMSPRPMAPRIG